MNSREYYIVRQRLSERSEAARNRVQRLHAFRSDSARMAAAADFAGRVRDSYLERLARRQARRAEPSSSVDARPVYVAFFQPPISLRSSGSRVQTPHVLRFVLLADGRGILSRHATVAQARLRMAAYNTSLAGRKDPATLYEVEGSNWTPI